MYVGGPAGSPEGRGYSIGPANASRPDVGAAYPGVGDNHGYDAVVDAAGGTQVVYVYAINVGSGQNVLLGQRSVAVADPNPTGSFDQAGSPQGGEVRVAGWTFDPNDPQAAISFHVYVGGPAGDPNGEGHAFGPADGSRPDVGSAFPAAGSNHGYDLTFATGKTGMQPVYVYAINVGPGDNVLLGSTTVDVGTGPPRIRSTGAPRITGVMKVGRTLRATVGVWSVSDVDVTFRWLRDGKVIRGADARSYRLTPASRGKRITVRVTARKTGYTRGSARSAPTRRVT
ncbi:hypothetical protein H5V45_04280 [Nocardioides sp. KIGAM211]|uniref:Ig-like domain-containing protein n=1 Tax=Nocardioides luti TaxID=2761101 RepID=A0A7X0RDY9_9ACTN|nr:hypothetical protein [Nocardioides luti]MBB6626536.1 hypothetical protein [Nocardioides luti]